MKEYTILFEFFGRKMKHTLYAYSEADAMKRVKQRINFYQVKEVPNHVVDFLKGFSK